MRIPSHYIDRNGHMNVRHYIGIFDDCGTPTLVRQGLPLEWLTAHHRGVMDVENHIRFLHEVMEGEEVTVHARLIGRTEKALHWMEFLVNNTRANLAATLEMLTVHVDLVTRRATAWRAEAAAALDAQIATDGALPWAAPVSGCIALRQGAIAPAVT